MNQLTPAAIAIIGGADGPTSIYVKNGAVFQYLLPWFLLFALAVFFLVRSILKKRKLGIILSSVFCVIFLIPPAAFFLGNFLINRQSEKWSELKSTAVPWNENGILCIFDDSPEERECIKIEKIWLEEDVLYAVRNQQLAKYKYYSESALSEEK